MTPQQRSSLDDARRFFALLARPGDVFELRGLAKNDRGAPYVTSGYFDDIDALVKAAVERSGKDTGVYVTLNPVNPALLARAPKNQLRRAGNGDTTSDRDVRQRRNILIDVDPVRPAGISSTNAEHVQAIGVAWQIAADLSDAGWPEPIIADSGNGGHVIFGVDLPVEDGGLVKRVLERLSKKYSTAELKVDEKVFNAARISKIYGTLTKKGEDTPDRPHRMAMLLYEPERLVEVPHAMLEAFAPAAAPAQRTAPGASEYKGPAFDLDAWIAQHLPDAVATSWSEGRKWLLPICPFNSDHNRKEAYVTQKHGGQIAAGCQHESCFRSWKELREHFEPGAYKRNGNGHASGNGHVNGHKTTNREPPPEVVYQHPDYEPDVDAFADRDREPGPQTSDAAPPRKPVWKRAPELVAAIMERAADPWVALTLAGEVLARIRAGGTAVIIGGSGSGKSSLASCMLVEHARDVGPAIALSIELPAEELAARIVSQRCDASWEDALCGRVPGQDMARVLDLPRLYVLDRRRATIANLEKVVDAARAEYPGQPILVAIDYAQLLDSKEREARMRAADAFAQIDDCAREKKFVAIALSQMSRLSAQKARRGEALGAESSDLGAESAAIERFATVTMAIGLAAEREDGSQAVELSIGKSRMSKGDRVIPMTYYGRSGLWRVAGDAKTADAVRETREVEKNVKIDRTLEAALVAVAGKSKEPLSRKDLKSEIAGNGTRKTMAIARLLRTGELVQVMKRARGARKGDWMIWTPDRAADAGIQIVPFSEEHPQLELENNL